MTRAAVAARKRPTSGATPQEASTSDDDPLTVLLNPALLQPAPNLAQGAGTALPSARLGAAQCISAGQPKEEVHKLSRPNPRRFPSPKRNGGWRRPFPTAWLVICAQHDAVAAGLALWHASGRQASFEMTALDFKPWVRNPALVIPMLNRLKGAALIRYKNQGDGIISVRPYFGLANRLRVPPCPRQSMKQERTRYTVAKVATHRETPSP
jgi:hypothetical protein